MQYIHKGFYSCIYDLPLLQYTSTVTVVLYVPDKITEKIIYELLLVHNWLLANSSKLVIHVFGSPGVARLHATPGMVIGYRPLPLKNKTRAFILVVVHLFFH